MPAVAMSVALVTGACGGDVDPPQGRDGYIQTELPMRLQLAPPIIAINGAGDLAAVEPGYSGGPGRVLLLESGAQSTSAFRVRVTSDALALSDDDTVVYETEGVVYSVGMDAAEGEELDFGIDADAESIESVGVDGAGNIYALVYKSFTYRVLKSAPDTAKPVELPFGELEGVEKMTVTTAGDVILLGSLPDAVSVVTLMHDAKAPVTSTVTTEFTPTDMAMGPDNSLYLLDGESGPDRPQILVFDRNSEPAQSISFSATLNGNHELAVRDDGTVYVTDSNRVFQLTRG